MHQPYSSCTLQAIACKPQNHQLYYHCLHSMILQVDIVEDESTGKRTIKTTSICWGNKLSLLVSTPFYDPRLLPNSKDPDLDFSQAQIEVNTEADWVKASTSLKSIPLKMLLMSFRVCNSTELVVPLLLHCSYPNASSLHSLQQSTTRLMPACLRSCRNLQHTSSWCRWPHCTAKSTRREA